jgi:molecular chaperone GrpE
MATDKRHIPINGNPPAGAAPSASTGNAGQSGRAVAPGGSRAAHGAPAAALQALTAERDALARERDALVTERDALVAENEALLTERDALAAERDTLNDSLLRLRAEFENYRRRTTREVIDAGTRAQCDLLGSLLPVLDNLDRALDAAEHHEEGKVLEGVRLTRKMFVDLLGCTGVEEVAGVGAPFDPHQHEAIMVQTSDQEEGTVAAVLQKGYRQGDRVLRPAKVAVSAGKGEPAIAG